MVYYPRGLHQQEAFAGCSAGVKPENTEAACSGVLSLPMHPYLTEAEIEQICSAIKSFLEYGSFLPKIFSFMLLICKNPSLLAERGEELCFTRFLFCE
jgi:hypothetical protein